MRSRPRLQSQLLTVQETADLLKVSRRTVEKWISHDAVPYVQLPGGGSYRVPMQGLLNSLSGTYDLAAELETLLRGAQRDPLREDEIAAALDE
jgi:excisionase family DNA binding protein